MDVDSAGAAFETEFVAVGVRDRVSNGCLYVDYFLNYLSVMTFPQVGF